MSDETGTPGTPEGPAGGPRPEPLRFFGTSWVHHDDGYALRRTGVAIGSLAAAVVSCLVLRFAFQGIRIAGTGTFVTVLIVAMFAVCTALAFGNTWGGFGKRPDPQRQSSLRGLLAIGFVGILLAYFLRSLTEAPGERLHREEYETARAEHAARTTRRSGNPAKKKRRR
ncbi:EamA/RhaT family transporter [Streptomyces misionensis]|uniref:EamA/RhaT family transporter n=1 Tax=Streptomyces misionensis TaxID=67331 RepID=UPI0034323174